MLKRLYLSFVTACCAVSLFCIFVFFSPVLQKDQIIQMEAGQGSFSVLDKLEMDHLSFVTIWKPVVKVFIYFYPFNIKKGEFQLQENMTLWEILSHLQQGKVIERYVTLPEGITVYQALKIIDTLQGLEGEIDFSSVEEGDFLPETYAYVRGEKKKI